MDDELSCYLEELRQQYPKKEFPSFCTTHSCDIKEKTVLFWNFFPYFGWDGSQAAEPSRLWAKELYNLATLLPHLKVIVVSGNVAWKGMKYFELIANVPLVFAPHPSRFGMVPKGNKEWLEKSWRKAKELANRQDLN